MINCEFSNPLNSEQEPPKPDEFWNFKNLTCSEPTIQVEISPSPYVVLIETEKGNFWLNKSWTFGDLFISFILIGFLFIVISRGVWNFFYPRLVKMKK